MRSSSSLLLNVAAVAILFIVGTLVNTAEAGGRNILREARSFAANTETHLNTAFVHSTDYLETKYLDTSLNGQFVTNQSPFLAGSLCCCTNVTTNALQYAKDVIKEEADTIAAKKPLRDLPLDDTDNMHRLRFEAMEMVKRKVRLWNEDTKKSTPVSCITREKPQTIEQTMQQRHKYRILCVTFTYIKNNNKAALLNKAWGRRCHRHIIITNKDAGLSEKVEGGAKNVIQLTPDGGEGYTNMWQKTRATLLYFKKQQEVRMKQDLQAKKKNSDSNVAQSTHRSERDEILAQVGRDESNPNDLGPNMRPGDEIILTSYDYIFFAGDDVLMVPENLHKMINEPTVEGLHQMGTPLHFGYRQITVADIPFISGAGYVLNSVALQLMTLVALSNREVCSPTIHASAEDVYLAMCLEKALGVVSRDTRDAFGEDRFNILNVEMHTLEARFHSYSWWWRDYRDRAVPRGINTISRDAVLFHYLQTDEELRRLTEAVYGTVI